jgi:hypothetical protein
MEECSGARRSGGGRYPAALPTTSQGADSAIVFGVVGLEESVYQRSEHGESIESQ